MSEKQTRFNKKDVQLADSYNLEKTLLTPPLANKINEMKKIKQGTRR